MKKWCSVPPAPDRLWRPHHQPRPHLPIPFPPKAEARRPLDIHYGWAGLDAGARSAPPRVMWLIIALWRHPCPLSPELSGHRRQSAIIVPPKGGTGENTETGQPPSAVPYSSLVDLLLTYCLLLTEIPYFFAKS